MIPQLLLSSGNPLKDGRNCVPGGCRLNGLEEVSMATKFRTVLTQVYMIEKSRKLKHYNVVPILSSVVSVPKPTLILTGAVAEANFGRSLAQVLQCCFRTVICHRQAHG